LGQHTDFPEFLHGAKDAALVFFNLLFFKKIKLQKKINVCLVQAVGPKGRGAGTEC
jgi:hypothetical protein